MLHYLDNPGDWNELLQDFRTHWSKGEVGIETITRARARCTCARQSA